MERYINVNDITLKGVAVFDENLDLLIPLSDVRKALQLAPAADVAPKSEVAREIFEEIEEMLNLLKIYNPYDSMLNVVGQNLAELKKKYTKDCTTCGHMVSCEPNPFGICKDYDERKEDEGK